MDLNKLQSTASMEEKKQIIGNAIYSVIDAAIGNKQ